MAKRLSQEAESTRNSLEYVGAGAGLIGASAVADAVVGADRKRRGMDGPIKAAAKRKFTRRHAGQLGVKVGGRAAFAAGAPLAAYGAYTAMKPKERTPRLNVKRDVVRPVAQGVALKDLADQQQRRVGKADLSRKDTDTLVARKKRGQKISIVAGAMGIGALGLRAPEAAKFAAKKAPKLSQMKGMSSMAAREPSATKASNALGIASIGTGAAGSLNYAAQQKLETKAIRKSLPVAVDKPSAVQGQQMELDFGKALPSAIRNGSVTNPYAAKRVASRREGRKAARMVRDSRAHDATATRLAREGGGRLIAAEAAGVDAKTLNMLRAGYVGGTNQMQTIGRVKRAEAGAAIQRGKDAKVGKSDRFLRKYGNRISPEAEKGYTYLRAGRNQRRGEAAVEFGTGAALTGIGAASMFGNQNRLRTRGGKIGFAAGAATAGLGALATISGGDKAASARSWNKKMKKIQVKGRERAKLGVYGPGREVVKSAGRKAEGTAQVAAGGAALGLGLSTNRLVNVAESAGRQRVERWQSKKVAGVGPVVSRTQPGASQSAKTREAKRSKARQGQVNEINAKANKTKGLVGRAAGGKTRGALITAGFAAGVPNVWLGSRKAVEKADKHDVDSFAAGALGGAGAYHGALYSTKRVDRRIERNIATSLDMKKKLNEHRKSVGLPKDARKGDARWLKYNREYPKSLPGAKWKRSMSRLQGGKSQVGITAGVAGVTGLSAMAVNRKIDPVSERRVGKSLGLRPLSAVAPVRPRMRKPSIRQSYVARSASGRKFTVRGSVR